MSNTLKRDHCFVKQMLDYAFMLQIIKLHCSSPLSVCKCKILLRHRLILNSALRASFPPESDLQMQMHILLGTRSSRDLGGDCILQHHQTAKEKPMQTTGRNYLTLNRLKIIHRDNWEQEEHLFWDPDQVQAGDRH